MTGSFTSQGKTSPSAKTQRCEVGAWQMGQGEESLFLLRPCGKAGTQPPSWAGRRPGQGLLPESSMGLGRARKPLEGRKL
jgi:hypothetical protein